MEGTLSSDRHYRVVRYFTDFSAGLITETVAQDLTLDEAEKIVMKEGEVPGEEMVIEDQAKQGLESEVASDARAIDSDDRAERGSRH